MRIMLLLLLLTNSMLGQNFSDCKSALSLCDLSNFSIDHLNDYGEVKEDQIINYCGLDLLESNSFWIRFKAKTEGDLSFIIMPHNIEDDIDFMVFQTPDNCSRFTELRCMASGKSLGNNVNARCLGITGLAFGSDDVFEEAGCDYSSDNFLRPIGLEKESYYYIYINNHSGNSGFSISFEGNVEFDKLEGCNSVDANGYNTMNLYPNPAHDIVNLKLNVDRSNNFELQVLDLKGSILRTRNINLVKGQNIIQLSAREFIDGMYLVRLNDGEVVLQDYFIKK